MALRVAVSLLWSALPALRDTAAPRRRARPAPDAERHLGLRHRSLSLVSTRPYLVNAGDSNANYFQDSTNLALFTHNIFNITDKLSLTLGLRTPTRQEIPATFNNNNTICAPQQAFFANFLSGGVTPLPGGAPAGSGGRPAPSGNPQGIVDSTCQGSSTSALNGLNPRLARRGRVHRHRRPLLRPTTRAALRQLFARL